MLRYLMDTVTQMTQVQNEAMLIYFGSNIVNIFPQLMRVIMIEYGIV